MLLTKLLHQQREENYEQEVGSPMMRIDKPSYCIHCRLLHNVSHKPPSRSQKMIDAFKSREEFYRNKSIKVDLHVLVHVHVTRTLYLHVIFVQSLCRHEQ